MRKCKSNGLSQSDNCDITLIRVGSDVLIGGGIVGVV